MSKFPENEFEFKKDTIDQTYESSMNYFSKKDLSNEYSDQQYSFELLSDLYTGDVYKMLNGLGFGAIEASMELSNSLHLTLHGYYRYAYLALRNCLELIVLSTYFVKFQPSTDISDYKSIEDWWNNSRVNNKYLNWLNSEDSTPFFSKMLDVLIKKDYYQKYNNKFNLVKNVKTLYYELSDFIHIKGKNKSTEFFEGNFIFNYSRSNIFSEEKFNYYWELRKKVVRYSALIVLLEFPIGLKGFDLERKFGFNEPTGFVSEGQASLLRFLLNAEELLFFDTEIKNDPYIIAIEEFINSQPDITEKEVDKQIKEFRERFSSTS